MDNQKRLLLAIALSFGLTLVWSKFFYEPNHQAEIAAAEAAAAGALDAGVAVAPGTTPPAGSETMVAAAETDGGVAAPAPAPAAPAREVLVDRASTHFTFQSVGAGLSHAVLQGAKEHVQPEVSLVEGWKRLFGAPKPALEPMDLAVPVPGRPLPLSLSIGGAVPVPAELAWTVAEASESKVVFTAQSGPWRLKKTFEWGAEPYEPKLTVEAAVESQVPVAGELVLHAVRGIDPAKEQAPSMFGGVGNQSIALCHVGDDVERVRPNEDPPVTKKGQLGFFGIDQQYFLTALYPLGGQREGSCTMTANKTVRAIDAAFPFVAEAGKPAVLAFGIFMGPKDLELLGKVAAGAGPGAAATTSANYPALGRAVDFGIWAAICKVMLPTLKFFFGLMGNWGLAIIALTVLVKVLLLPLTHKAMVSAEAMKKLAPRMEEIKKKYPDDRERQNLETMKLYQEAKVNPLGGCLPLLLQIPVWGALFTTLRNSYELYGEPFVGPVWVDLTYKDPTYLLPLALGITMIITQRAQPQMMDAAQAKIMTWFMPIFFTAIMMNYPAGLALYIFTNNLLSIAQQQLLKRYLARKAEAVDGKPQASGA
ncbi:MAG: membrane protein insertase YidC [Myxococcaceae bacterium]|nr:membrane protein insertase YidC [Myxococcaceae bacterium]